MSSYHLCKITPLSELQSRDRRYLSMALEAAETSVFHSSLRLGACLKGKGERLLPRRKSIQANDRSSLSYVSSC